MAGLTGTHGEFVGLPGYEGLWALWTMVRGQGKPLVLPELPIVGSEGQTHGLDEGGVCRASAALSRPEWASALATTGGPRPECPPASRPVPSSRPESLDREEQQL